MGRNDKSILRRRLRQERTPQECGDARFDMQGEFGGHPQNGSQAFPSATLQRPPPRELAGQFPQISVSRREWFFVSARPPPWLSRVENEAWIHLIAVKRGCQLPFDFVAGPDLHAAPGVEICWETGMPR